MRSLAIVLVLVIAGHSAAIGGPTRTARRAPSAKRAPPAKRPPPAKRAPPAKAMRDVRTTLEAVVVRKQPGERQAAVATLPAGTEVLVEAEEGRWLRVRAGKVAGYLARTTVTDPPPPPAPPDTGAAVPVEATAAAPAPEPGKQRTWSSARRLDPATAPLTELYVEVTAEASSLRAEARPEAGIVARVARGARLAVAEVNDAAGWLRARDDAGNTGWIARGEVGNGTAAVVAADAPGELAAPRASATPGRAVSLERRALSLRADAGIGFRTFGMDFQSNGSAGLANYLVASSASAADLELEVAVRPRGRWRFAVDGRVQLSRSSPGIDYPGPTGPPGKIAFDTFGADAGVRAGVRVRSLFELWLRGGGHYDAFVARDVENAGRLPRERLVGATAGARADITPPRSRVSATLWADALVLGSRRQTPGLEDGTDSVVRAVWAGMTLRVRFARRLSILAAYDFGRVSTRWSGMSVREPGVTEALRRDASQLVQVGLGAEM